MVTGFAAAVVGVAAGMWVLLLQDAHDEGSEGAVGAAVTESAVVVLEQPPDVGPNGLPVRPHVRLDHPDGTVADVPAAEVLYGEFVDLRRVTLPDDSATWDWDGPAWQFVSNAGLVITDDVTFTLPASGSDGEAVLALSHTGDWIELTSAAAALPSGGPAREVQVGKVPVPWILVVARPAGVASNVEPPEGRVLEQLYWTDREEWERKATASVTEVLRAVGGDTLVSLHPAAQSKERYPWDLRRDLDAAFQLLGAARLGGVLDQTAAGTPVPVIGLTPFALYVEGLDRLDAVRKEWFQRQDTWRQTYTEAELSYSDEQSLEQAIESALAYYAPWGIDLTRFLLHTGTVGAFDMRVVGPYGELPHADAPLSTCREHTVIGPDIPEPAEGGATVNCYLRLYSRAAMQDTWVDWLKDWKLQTVVRWAPALLVTAGLVSGAAAPAVLFAAADQLISFVQDHYSEDAPSAYLNTEVASASGAAGAFVTDTAAGLLRVEGASTSLTGSGLGIAQTIYSVALLYGVSQTDWYMLQEVRSLTAGTRSYCPKGNCAKSWWTGDAVPIAGYDQIPPIQVVAVIQDTPPGHPADGYPAQRTRVRVWTLPLPRYGADLHQRFMSRVTCEAVTLGIGNDVLCPPRAVWRGGLTDLPFEPYKKEQWPIVVERSAPAGQSIRVSVPREILDAIAADYELGPPPDVADYGIVLRVEAPDGSRASFTVDRAAEPQPGDDPNRLYVSLVIPGDWNGEPAALDELDRAYEGARSRMSNDILQTRLTVELWAHADEEPRATAVVDFKAPGVKDIEVYPSHVGMEHIHVTGIDLAGGLPSAWQITSLTLTEAGTFNEPAMYRTNLPKLRRVGANGQACRIEVATYEGEAPQLYLSCVFEAGCPGDDSCDAWPLAGKNRISDELAGSLSITPTIVEGQACTLLVGEPLTCNMLFSISAELSQSGTLSGTFQVWSRYYGDGSEGTLTFIFTAVAIR